MTKMKKKKKITKNEKMIKGCQGRVYDTVIAMKWSVKRKKRKVIKKKHENVLFAQIKEPKFQFMNSKNQELR